ncbi:MAG: hypothetical protein ACD_58C00110G0002 [uncultured bacterium]|nr:MAG: hypothetical protein ACD_58C00110G0002 [uncultured bacterium]
MSKLIGKNSNVLITCSDPRVIKWLHDKNVRKKLSIDGGSFSTIANTGSIKFYLNEKLMDKLFVQLDILTHHFSPEKIILLNHTDCGYYKSLGQDEEEFYLEDLTNVSDLIKEKYPNLIVEKYLLDTKTGELK